MVHSDCILQQKKSGLVKNVTISSYLAMKQQAKGMKIRIWSYISNIKGGSKIGFLPLAIQTYVTKSAKWRHPMCKFGNIWTRLPYHK